MTINERVSPETLDKIIEAADEVITALAGTNEDVHKNDSAKMCQLWDDLNDRYATPAIVKALAAEIKQYRAATEKPVACIDRANLDYLDSGAGADVWPASESDSDDVLLYAAPQLPQPAPVAVPDEMEMDDDFDSAFEHGKAVGWNACRAAMLQGAEPVSQPDELPLDYLQGHKDGLEWAARLAEANHPQTGDWLFDDPIELAKAIRKGPDMLPAEPGNSPAIPDGYALVPIRLTAENGAKELLSGEFSETKFISCPECFGDDECETCDGSGRIEITVPVSWTTIKEIWAKGVEHFAAAPKQEAL